MDRDLPGPARPVPPGRTSGQCGDAGDRTPGGPQLPLGVRRAAVLRRRGGLLHQRRHDPDRCPSRRRRRAGGTPAPGRPDAGWWLELLGPDASSTVVLRQHPGRDRRAAEVGAPYRRIRGGPTGPPERGGVPAPAQPLPVAAHGRGGERSVGDVLLPATLAVRPAQGHGVLRHAWGHSGSAPGRSDRTRPREAPLRGALAAGEHPPRRGPLPVRGPDGTPSRWNTLRALRVLRWYDAPAHRPGA
jgi:hypothetical protein